MNSDIASSRPGLYIHIPFCRSKCLYCDFYSVASRAAIPAWLQAVQTEVVLYKERFHDFDSLYLGGGTPAILSEKELAELLECIHKHFTFCPGSEMTIEANPDGLSRDKLKVIGSLGINRISLGVQSLDDRDLKYLGRSHGSKQALKSLDMVRSCGFADLGADLMYGLETQSMQGWRRTLDQILEFRPEHISCYQLTFESGAPLWKMKAAGRVRSIGEKLESAFFIWTSRYLDKRGYQHYEISNFARGPEFMCRHNLKYWGHIPYLGLGPSAHSFHAGSRWWNVKSIRKYCRLLAEGKAPVEASEVLSEEQLDLETLHLGLRTSAGVDLHALGGRLIMDEALAELQKSGLVKVTNGRIQPSRKGFLVADSLPLMLCS
ncbi:MAG: radical SAM family heme chaperone HemW [Syntrophobacteraceae bacterium]|jgi:oxygen-independent coproporphyrinogen-3 oxidase